MAEMLVRSVYRNVATRPLRAGLLALLFACSVLAAGCGGSSGGGAAPNTQKALLGPNVYIFGPESSNVQDTISSIYAMQMGKAGEFDENRYAFLFKPGAYNLDVRVGYYTQVAGLGLSPDDVTITGAVRTQDNPDTKPINEGPGALDNFWRSAENLSIIPTLGSLTLGPPSDVPNTPGGIPLNQNVWSVSQAAPLRRIHIKPSPITLTPTECANAIFYYPDRKKTDPLISTCPTTLRLFDVGYSSGGFMADSRTDGLVESGSQQQWFSRNCNWTQWNSENWNMVFLGSIPVPAGTWPGTPTSDGAITDGGPTPLIREKPFLYIDNAGNYSVLVPDLQNNRNGVDWDGTALPGRSIPIKDFYIVKAQKKGTHNVIDAGSINAALDSGKNLLVTPGVYYLNGTIEIKNPDTVVLGMGEATIVANDGNPIIAISDVDGVSVAGVLLDAGPTNSTTLMQVGEPGSTADHSADPTFLYDLFCRVGGADHVGKATSCVTINSNDVIGDDLWLWRADHGSNVGWTQNPAANGLIVNGNHVWMYGLAVEHFQQYQTVWNGDFGRTYFYQSEMPYDVPNQAAWRDPAQGNGYASYKIADGVTDHKAWGVGVYSFFMDAPVIADRAIEVPSAIVPGFTDMVTFWLNGQPGSEITHIINDSGLAVTATNRKATLPEFPGAPPAPEYFP
ncbi:MAG: coagulation factor 5/8 type domain-containing protein [Candidatus Acidiferrum sp.]